MGKHAYLIIAQNDFKVLENLLLMIDDERNDIFLHIGKKIKNFDTDYFIHLLKKSKLYIYREYSTYFEDESMVRCELFLLGEAVKRDTYDYYHYLSGCDLPLKNQDYIHSFFDEHAGKEFIHFNDDYLNHTRRVKYRMSLYHLFQKQCFQSHFKFLTNLFSWIEKFSLFIQLIFKVNRQRKSCLTLKYGSNFFSITHNLALYICSKNNEIKSFSLKSCCADNFFLQTFVYNSPFIDKLYMPNQSYGCLMNMREFNWKHSFSIKTLYIWKDSDFDYLSITPCLFASKFSENNMDIVYKLYKLVMTKKSLNEFPQNKNNP